MKGPKPAPRALCAYCHTRPVSRPGHPFCSKAHSNAARARALALRLAETCVPGIPGACWEFTGCRDRNGYGVITDDAGHQKRVARLIYEREIGPIPRGKQVLHTCDNPPCWNPEHLKVGTCRENNDDKARKLRAPSKLKPDDVREIRRMLSYGATLRTCADRFGVTSGAIFGIRHNRTWKHLA